MIHVENLHFTYRGNKQATLHGLNFAVANEEIFGFLGPSGAGKSTTQKILIGMLQNFQGKVTVGGQNMRGVGADLYETMGVAFETPNLYSKFTARENLEFFSKLYAGDTRAPDELLEKFSLLDAADTRVSDFSKGMKVRLNVCRSLLNKPTILFLDEPTSGLDPVNLRRVLDVVREERRNGTTVCITTHDMHVADELCDRVAFIVDGQVDLIDSPRDLKLQHGERRIDVEYKEDGALHQSSFPFEGLYQDQHFQNLIAGGNIETIHSKEASLEDVFVKTTGTKLT